MAKFLMKSSSRKESLLPICHHCESWVILHHPKSASIVQKEVKKYKTDCKLFNSFSLVLLPPCIWGKLPKSWREMNFPCAKCKVCCFLNGRIWSDMIAEEAAFVYSERAPHSVVASKALAALMRGSN